MATEAKGSAVHGLVADVLPVPLLGYVEEAGRSILTAKLLLIIVLEHLFVERWENESTCPIMYLLEPLCQCEVQSICLAEVLLDRAFILIFSGCRLPWYRLSRIIPGMNANS